MAQTLTIQNVVNYAATQTELMPLAGVGGYANEPALSFANDIVSELLMGGGLLFGEKFGPHPWKCNEATSNLFVCSYGKNDYLWAGASAFTTTGSSTAAAIELKSNNGITESAGTVTVKTLEAHNFVVGDTVYHTGLPDAAYNSTFTAGPQSSTWSNGFAILTVGADKKSYTFATGSGQSGLTSGASGISDFSWGQSFSYVQMTDNSVPQQQRHGTFVRKLHPFALVGGFPSRMAMVQDLGTGVLKLRVQPLPGSTPIGITFVYQKSAPVITSLGAFWGPFHDEDSAMIRQCFLARAYRHINSKRSEVELQKAESLILAARGRDDAEDSEDYITPDSSLMGWFGGGGAGGWL